MFATGDKQAGIILAVPTAHHHSAEMIARDVEALYCTNIRGGLSYAVASTYRHWSDVGYFAPKMVCLRSKNGYFLSFL